MPQCTQFRQAFTLIITIIMFTSKTLDKLLPLNEIYYTEVEKVGIDFITAVSSIKNNKKPNEQLMNGWP